MSSLKRMSLVLLVLLVFTSISSAAPRGGRRYGRLFGITVRTPGGGRYTWYGPGGVAAARRAAAAYYAPAQNTTPVQRDVEQKRSLRFATFPTLNRRQ